MLGGRVKPVPQAVYRPEKLRIGIWASIFSACYQGSVVVSTMPPFSSLLGCLLLQCRVNFSIAQSSLDCQENSLVSTSGSPLWTTPWTRFHRVHLSAFYPSAYHFLAYMSKQCCCRSMLAVWISCRSVWTTVLLRPVLSCANPGSHGFPVGVTSCT